MKRIFRLCLTICITALISCEKETEVPPVDQEPAFYFSATIDGKDIKYEVKDSSSEYLCFVGRREYAEETTEFYHSEGTSFSGKATTLKNTVWVKVLKYFDHYPDSNDRLGMLRTGNYNYAFRNGFGTWTDGAIVEYFDEEGKLWLSDPGAQAGNAFTVTDITESTGTNFKKIFKAAFNCKLYDVDGIESLQLSNGIVKGKMFLREE